MTPCNVSVLERLCDASSGCAGFNTNGWLQAVIDPGSLKNSSSCDLYVRDAGPAAAYVFPAAAPGPPLPVVSDFHYPEEERAEAAGDPAPTVLGLKLNASHCTVRLRKLDASGGNGDAVTADVRVPGQFGGWELLACLGE